MGKRNSLEQFRIWYGPKPETAGEQDLTMFANFIPGVLSELRAFGETGAQQLQELFAVAGLGVIDLLSLVREQDAARRLRLLFGMPNLELEGSVPVALDLHSTEATAVDAAQEQRSGVQRFWETCIQMAIQELLSLQASLSALEEKIQAKEQAVGETNMMQLHAETLSSKVSFVGYTNNRLEAMRRQRDKLQEKIAVLSHAISGVADPLLEVTQDLVSQLKVSTLKAGEAIPVEAVAQAI